ncbi:type IV pilus modification protein PilV [Luteimonas sp. R10]|uniref:type IV pilus modification protein PilV n=1 Tax=Luteimonas sp. R10 TaxID=3108176 RepID=UPI00309306A3|nr:type IV pilus modification protein PilV [Luteimonas sp. R10]
MTAIRSRRVRLRRSARHVGHWRQRGASLIEVLIAVLIMAVGMLGIAAMQTTALRNSQSSLERSQAVIQTYAIFDAMRANREQALAGAYNMARTCLVSAGGATLAENDHREWLSSLQDTLGDDACGEIDCPDASACSVTVEWNDSRASDGGVTGIAGDTRTVTTTTLL